MEDSSCPRKRPWFLTFVGLLAMAALIAMPFLAGKPDGSKMPDWYRFIGHFHPVLLHLPIGVFLLIVCQELGAMFFRRGKTRDTNLFPMFFGAASAIAAVVAGFLLFHGHGDDYGGNELAERHLWGGLIFAVAAVFTFIVKAWTVSTAGNPAWYRLLLFGSVGVMSFASHDGASLTHGSDYLTKYAPDPIRKILGLEPKQKLEEESVLPADPVVYVDLVAPILERRCVSCHKAGKAKGKLRLDTFEMMVKGGTEGPAIEAGSSADSILVEYIELPEDDEFHMPPEGKPDIEDNELAVLKWWIDSGADPVKKLSELAGADGVRDAIASLGNLKPAAPEENKSAAPAQTGPDDELKRVVSGLASEFPGAVSFESQDSPLVTFTAMSLRGNLDDNGFAKISPLIPHLVSVDLSATKVTDRSVASLAPAKNLRMLRLAETGITDAAIETLAKLPALESVNFYGTAISDEGVMKLAAMPNLKRLYLWQTKVSPETIEKLKQELPGCEIVTGT